MTEAEIIELYEERLAIMLEANSQEVRLFGEKEMTKRLSRAAFFDIKKQLGGIVMPRSIWPDRQEIKPQQAMRNENAKHIDYGFLVGSIPNSPNAIPSNLDGISERNGWFLVLEFKRAGESFGNGQRYMLEALANAPKFEVWIVTGNFETSPIEFGCVERLLPNKMKQIVATTLDEFRLKYRAWYTRSSSKSVDW